MSWGTCLEITFEIRFPRHLLSIQILIDVLISLKNMCLLSKFILSLCKHEMICRKVGAHFEYPKMLALA